MLGPSGFRDGQARRNGTANSNQSSFSVQCFVQVLEAAKGLKYFRWMLGVNSPGLCNICRLPFGWSNLPRSVVMHSFHTYRQMLWVLANFIDIFG